MTCCVLEYAGTNSSKIAQSAFVKQFSKKSPSAKQIWIWKKIQKQMMSAQSKSIWTISNFGREGRVGSPNTLMKPPKVRK